MLMPFHTQLLNGSPLDAAGSDTHVDNLSVTVNSPHAF